MRLSRVHNHLLHFTCVQENASNTSLACTHTHLFHLTCQGLVKGPGEFGRGLGHGVQAFTGGIFGGVAGAGVEAYGKPKSGKNVGRFFLTQCPNTKRE